MSVSYSEAGAYVPTFSRFRITLRRRRPHQPSGRPPCRPSPGAVEAGGHGAHLVVQYVPDYVCLSSSPLPATACLCRYHVPRGLTTLHRCILGKLALFSIVMWRTGSGNVRNVVVAHVPMGDTSEVLSYVRICLRN